MRIDGDQLADIVRHKLQSLEALVTDIARDVPHFGPQRFGQALLAMLDSKVARSILKSQTFDERAELRTHSID